MDLKDRIAVDPKILVGKPVIAGTRIAVEFVVDLLASGWSHEQIIANYPHLSEKDILACLQYAGELLHSEGLACGECVKFLADENFPIPALAELRNRGYDVSSIAEQHAGSPDEIVARICDPERRVLLTFDKDFGELIFGRGLAAGS